MTEPFDLWLNHSTKIDIHCKQQQVEVSLINVSFVLVPVLNAPENNPVLWYDKVMTTQTQHKIEFRVTINCYTQQADLTYIQRWKLTN